MTLEMQGARPFEQDLTFSSPLIAVLDNNLYHQYAILARIYDWSKRGTQTFSVLIPQELTPGSITVDWAGAVTADGKTYEGLKVVTADLEVVLYLDPGQKLDPRHGRRYRHNLTAPGGLAAPCARGWAHDRARGSAPAAFR